MRDDLFPSGIYFNQEDASQKVREEMQAEMEEMQEKMQGEIDDKQYEIDIRQEAFDDQYKFFERISEKYFDDKKPKEFTLKEFKKELVSFKISRRGEEWNVVDLLKSTMDKIEPEVIIERVYQDRIVYRTPEKWEKIIRGVILLLNDLL